MNAQIFAHPECTHNVLDMRALEEQTGMKAVIRRKVVEFVPLRDAYEETERRDYLAWPGAFPPPEAA